MKFPVKDFFSKCDQIRRKLRISSDLLRKSLMGNFIFVECIEEIYLRNVSRTLSIICDRDFCEKSFVIDV